MNEICDFLACIYINKFISIKIRYGYVANAYGAIGNITFLSIVHLRETLLYAQVYQNYDLFADCVLSKSHHLGEV